MATIRKCKICGNDFASVSRGKGIYTVTCSLKCAGISRKGRLPWNKGIKGSIRSWNKGLTKNDHPSIKRISEAKIGDKNPMWKGKVNSTDVLQRLVYEERGVVKKCTKCGAEDNIDIHHKDKDRSNYTKDNLIILCRSCHNLAHNRRKGTYGKCKTCGKTIYMKPYEIERKKYCSKKCQYPKSQIRGYYF
jgi:5-methylcytosine-specific restriction endonuclease McrA